METALSIGLANAAMAALLAVVMMGAALLVRRPALTHALGVLVLLKLLTPPMFGVPVGRWVEEPQTKGPAAMSVPVQDQGMAQQPRYWRVVEPFEREAELGGGGPPADEIQTEKRPAISPIVPVPARIAAPVIEQAHWNGWWIEWMKQSLPLMASLIWVSGSIICAMVIGFRIIRFHRLLGFAEVASPELQSRAAALAKRMGMERLPRVWLVPGAVCPMLWAVGKTSRLLVPSELWDRLGERQRSSLLAHELAHLRRRDHWVRWIEVAASVLYWWCPVMWYARRRLREAEEQCCDAWVVWAIPGSGREYAGALLETVEFVAAGGMGMRTVRSMPALASGMGQFHQLKRRLVMIKNQGVSKSLSGGGWVLVCALGLGVLPLTPTRAQTPIEPSPARPEAPASVDPAAAAPGGVSVSAAPGNETPRSVALPPVGAPAAGGPPALIDSARTSSIEIEKPLPQDGKPATVADAKISAELDATRAEIRELSVALDRAQRRLAALEGATARENYKRYLNKPVPAGNPFAPGEATPGPTLKFKNIDGSYNEATRSGNMAKAASSLPGMSDPKTRERRLDEIENNLRMLLDEVHSLKKERAAQKPEADPSREPGYSKDSAR